MDKFWGRVWVVSFFFWYFIRVVIYFWYSLYIFDIEKVVSLFWLNSRYWFYREILVGLWKIKFFIFLFISFVFMVFRYSCRYLSFRDIFFWFDFIVFLMMVIFFFNIVVFVILKCFLDFGYFRIVFWNSRNFNYRFILWGFFFVLRLNFVVFLFNFCFVFVK